MLNIDRLTKFLRATGFQVEESGNHELVIACPLCGDMKLRLYISKAHGRWLCFHCQEKGHLGQLLMEIGGLDRVAAELMERRLKTAPTKLGLEPIQEPEPATVVVPEACKPPPGYLSLVDLWDMPVTEPYRAYLEGRGLDLQTVARYQLGFVLLGDYARRVIIPIKVGGVVVTWLARSIDPDEELKVRNAPDRRSSQALFNIDNIQAPWVMLVEGVFDALRIPDLAAATLGARVSKWQRRYLKQQGFTNVVLCRDADDTGRNANARDALELMAAGFSVYIARLPLGVSDPGAATREEMELALAEAEPVTLSYSQELIKGGTTHA